MTAPRTARALIAIRIDAAGNAQPPNATIVNGGSVEFINEIPCADCNLSFTPSNVFGASTRIGKDSGIWTGQAERNDVLVEYWIDIRDEAIGDLRSGPYTIAVGRCTRKA